MDRARYARPKCTEYRNEQVLREQENKMRNSCRNSISFVVLYSDEWCSFYQLLLVLCHRRPVLQVNKREMWRFFSLNLLQMIYDLGFGQQPEHNIKTNKKRKYTLLTKMQLFSMPSIHCISAVLQSFCLILYICLFVEIWVGLMVFWHFICPLFVFKFFICNYMKRISNSVFVHPTHHC